jgi:[ribosomal protein S18]-alanine N-acetyltransferase
LRHVSPNLLRFHRRAEIQVPQRVKERDQEQKKQEESNQSKECFAPDWLFETFLLEGDNPLMSLAEIRRFEVFIYALEPGIEDVNAARHSCCYINDNDPIRSMTKTVIRHAVPADFNTLLEIDAASFPDGIAYDAQELAYFMSRAGAETLVADDDGGIVAFVIVEVHQTRRSATIVTLDVRETHRRSGEGTRLLMRAEDILSKHGVERYDLQVDVNNRAAIRFYKKHGLETVRTLRNYYANGNDAFLMVKQLM